MTPCIVSVEDTPLIFLSSPSSALTFSCHFQFYFYCKSLFIQFNKVYIFSKVKCVLNTSMCVYFATHYLRFSFLEDSTLLHMKIFQQASDWNAEVRLELFCFQIISNTNQLDGYKSQLLHEINIALLQVDPSLESTPRLLLGNTQVYLMLPQKRSWWHVCSWGTVCSGMMPQTCPSLDTFLRYFQDSRGQTKKQHSYLLLVTCLSHSRVKLGGIYVRCLLIVSAVRIIEFGRGTITQYTCTDKEYYHNGLQSILSLQALQRAFMRTW